MPPTTKTSAPDALAPGLIDQRIRDLGDWRGKTLARMRRLIRAALPTVTEQWKWGVPVWSQDGILCTGEAYKKAVKLTFPHGASLPDPAGLFNASLEGNARRAIDIAEDAEIDPRAFTELLRAAAQRNRDATSGRGRKSSSPRAAADGATPKVRLLSGGNPQIAMADGDAAVQAYIAAMPGWKRRVGEQLDALIVRALPDVRKAVKWNSPIYGLEDKGYFLGYHCFTRYVKVNFFQGQKLRPLPPGPSKDKDARYLDVHEDDVIDEAQFVKWVRQAAKQPGFLAPKPEKRAKPARSPRGPRR